MKSALQVSEAAEGLRRDGFSTVISTDVKQGSHNDPRPYV